MDGKVYTQTGVKLICLILTISVASSGGSSDGFRQDMNQTKSLPNVTQSVDTNVVIECRSECMNSTDQPSWFKYDHGKILIYNASSSSNSNSSKYLIGTGNKTLTVMNVQLSDAATYCCNVGGLNDCCSNVVVIGYVTASSRPWNRVEIGETVNLTCSLIYNSPAKDLDAPFPLSDDQDPKLSMFIGEDELLEELVVDVATVPHRKSISVNTTLVVADLDRNLECRVYSTKPWWYRATINQLARLDISIIYPNNAQSSNGEYKINDVFECVAEKFPFLNATWTDVTTPGTPRIISTGIGNATAKVLAAGKYTWTCSTTSPLKRNKVSTDLSFTARNLTDPEGNKASAGEKVTRPILLVAGYMLFIALIVC